MSVLATVERDAISAVLRRCGDDLLRRVSGLTDELRGERAAEFRAMLAEEFQDRGRRALVFGPLAPMFRPRTDDVASMTFPPAVLPRLWRLASAREPHLLAHLDFDDPRLGDVANRICQAAASAVRDQPELVWPVDVEPERRDSGLSDLAACLDLVHLARRALPSLEIWLKRPNGIQVAELRLLIKDCMAVRADGARRLIEILFAHLNEAALVLRLVTRVSEPARQESFLNASEFSGFVDRLLAGVQGRVDRIAAYVPGPDEGEFERLLRDLEWCAGTLAELDVTLELDPSSVWGQRAQETRLALSRRLSGLIAASEGAVDRALPLVRVKIAGRMTRMAPLATAPLGGKAREEALALLRVVGALRSAAGAFGCEAARKSAADGLSLRLTDYADELLSMVRDQEAPDPEHALALIREAALLLQALGAPEAARSVRRRAAVAGDCTPRVGASCRAA